MNSSVAKWNVDKAIGKLARNDCAACPKIRIESSRSCICGPPQVDPSQPPAPTTRTGTRPLAGDARTIGASRPATLRSRSISRCARPTATVHHGGTVRNGFGSSQCARDRGAATVDACRSGLSDSGAPYCRGYRDLCRLACEALCEGSCEAGRPFCLTTARAFFGDRRGGLNEIAHLPGYGPAGGQHFCAGLARRPNHQ